MDTGAGVLETVGFSLGCRDSDNRRIDNHAAVFRGFKRNAKEWEGGSEYWN